LAGSKFSNRFSLNPIGILQASAPVHLAFRKAHGFCALIAFRIKNHPAFCVFKHGTENSTAAHFQLDVQLTVHNSKHH
jgi:hypothetical protein